MNTDRLSKILIVSWVIFIVANIYMVMYGVHAYQKTNKIIEEIQITRNIITDCNDIESKGE